MADKRVEVLTRFRADSGALDRSVRRSALYAKNLNDRITSIAGSVTRMAGVAAGVAGFGGIGYAITKSAKDMIQFNRELETAKISIATVLQQRSAGGKGPFENWETALKGSSDTIRELEKRAAALPGTTDEFRRGFELVLPLTTRAGKSISDTIALAEKLVVQAKIGNVYGGVETVARDVQQILSGSASLAEINTIALKGRAKEIAEIARTDQSKAMREIEKVLAVGDSALKAFSGTFETQASTLQDSITRFVRTAGEPVFEWVTQKLTDWNAWLKKNEDRVKAIAKAVGDGIVKGIKTAGEWAKKLYDHWDDIKAVVRTVAEVYIAGKLVSGIATAIRAIKGAGGLTAAIKGMLGPLGLAVAMLETIRVSMANPLREHAEEKGAVIVTAHDIRRAYRLGQMDTQREEFFRSRLPNTTGHMFADTQDWLRQRAKGTVPGRDTDAIDRASDTLLLNLQREYEDTKQRERRAGAFRFDPGSFGGKLLGPLEAKSGVLTEAFDAEKPPNVDARGSTFNFSQKFEEGDPERIFFEIRSALVKPFLPRLGSTLAPS